MVVKFFDGFENDWRKRWLYTEQSTTISTVAGRTGNCVGLSTGGLGGKWAYIQTPSQGIGTGDTAILGFAVWVGQFNGESSIKGPWLKFFDDVEGIIGTMEIEANPTFSGGEHTDVASSVVIGTSQWYHFQVEYLPLNSGGLFRLEIDGTEAINVTGDTTSAAENFDAARWQSSNSSNLTYLDDIYLFDDTGTVNNTGPGDCRVKSQVPTGQGTHNAGDGSDGDSVDNHLLVDEDPVDEADYVELGGGARESYTFPALDGGDVPVAVRASSFPFGGDGTPTLDHFLRIGGTDHDAGDSHAVGLTGAWADSYWNVNPATASDWAEDDLDGAEAGVVRT